MREDPSYEVHLCWFDQSLFFNNEVINEKKERNMVGAK